MTQQPLVEFIKRVDCAVFARQVEGFFSVRKNYRCLWFKEETDVLMMIKGF